MARPLVGAPDASQPNLFDVDDPSLDDPVPYVLTARGRRAVDAEVPRLRVVRPAGRPGSDRDVPGDHVPHEDGLGDVPDDPREDDRRLVDDLEHTTTWRHARARALVRSGTPIEDVAVDLGVHTAVVRVWLAEPAVGPALGEAGDPDADVDDAIDLSGVLPADVQGVALLAACGTVETGAVLATTSRIAVAEAVVGWMRARHGVTTGQVRVILQVADRATADLVARAWADRLALTGDRVSTVEWRRAPGARSVQATVRISGRDLARRVAAQLDAWPLVD